MQFLLFSLGNDRYGLDTRRVLRVLPRLHLKEIPHAPPWVAGLMNFHGRPIPVIDLSMLACGRPGGTSFDTRIILVDYRDESNASHPLGLMAEQTNDIRHFSQENLVPPGVDNPDAPYLGQIANGGDGMVQLVDVDFLLPVEIRALLFPAETEAAS